MTVPTGPAPTTGGKLAGPPPPPIQPPTSSGGRTVKKAAAVTYVAIEAAPKSVRMKHGKVTVSLSCRATKGKTAKGKWCAGKFTLTISGHKTVHKFRFKSGKVDRISFKLPGAMRAAVVAAGGRTSRRLHGALVISTNLSTRKVQIRRGQLTIRS